MASLKFRAFTTDFQPLDSPFCVERGLLGGLWMRAYVVSVAKLYEIDLGNLPEPVI